MRCRSPLIDTEITGARGILLSIAGGDDLTLFEVNEAAEAVRAAATDDTNIIFGATLDERLTGQIWITVIATGLGGPRRRTFSGVTATPAPSGAAPRRATTRSSRRRSCGRSDDGRRERRTRGRDVDAGGRWRSGEVEHDDADERRERERRADGDRPHRPAPRRALRPRQVERTGGAGGDRHRRLESLDRDPDADRVGDADAAAPERERGRTARDADVAGRDRDRPARSIAGRITSAARNGLGTPSAVATEAAATSRASAPTAVHAITAAKARGERARAAMPPSRCAILWCFRQRADDSATPPTRTTAPQRTKTGQSGNAPVADAAITSAARVSAWRCAEACVHAARRPDPVGALDRLRAQRDLHRVAELRRRDRVDEAADADSRRRLPRADASTGGGERCAPRRSRREERHPESARADREPVRIRTRKCRQRVAHPRAEQPGRRRHGDERRERGDRESDPGR